MDTNSEDLIFHRKSIKYDKTYILIGLILFVPIKNLFNARLSRAKIVFGYRFSMAEKADMIPA